MKLLRLILFSVLYLAIYAAWAICILLLVPVSLAVAWTEYLMKRLKPACENPHTTFKLCSGR